MTLPKKDYAITVTILSDKEHHPVSFRCKIPEELAVVIMATPVTHVTLAVETTPGFISDKTGLLDFKY